MFLLPLLLRVFGTDALGAPKDTVEFWHSVENEPHKKIFDEVVKRFNVKNKNIRVQVSAVPGEVLKDVTNISKLMNAVSSGTGPDVYRLDRFTVAERAALKLLEELSPHVPNEGELRANFADFAIRESLFRDKLFAVPDNIDARALFYRKDILTSVGVNPAEFDSQKGPVSLDRFREVLAKVVKKNGQGELERLGLAIGKDQSFLHYTWGMAMGGVFASEVACEVTPTHPGVRSGFQFGIDYLKSLGGVEKYQNFLRRFGEQGEFEKEHPFITGRVAFSVNGPWIMKQFAKRLSPEQWGVTYIPAVGKEKFTWSGGWSYVIPKGARNPKGAMEFIRFLTAPETQKELIRDLGILPSHKRLLKEPPPLSREMAFFFSLMPFSRARPALPVSAMYWKELEQIQEKVLSDEKYSSAQLSRELELVREKVQRRLQRYCN